PPHHYTPSLHDALPISELVRNTTNSKIIHLVEETQDERTPSQAFVDKFAKYYTLIIIWWELGNLGLSRASCSCRWLSLCISYFKDRKSTRLNSSHVSIS